jgi:hypothetical protein
MHKLCSSILASVILRLSTAANKAAAKTHSLRLQFCKKPGRITAQYAPWLVPAFFVLFSSWLKQDAIGINQPAPGNLQILASYLAGVFVLGLGCAALCALGVGLCAKLLGIGEVIWHGSFYAPEQLNHHLLSYLLGLPLSLKLIWFVLLRPGMPLYRVIARLC